MTNIEENVIKFPSTELIVLSSSALSYGLIEDLSLSEIRLPLNILRSPVEESQIDENEGLFKSIAQKGLLQPIIVRTVEDKPVYEIVAGCRRYFACKKLGWRKIPCQITELTDKEAFEVSITENVQRRTLSATEEGKAFKRYVSDYGWGGVSELAAKLGKSVAYITKRMLLLDLPTDVINAIKQHSLTPSAAEELIYLENQQNKSSLAKLIIERHLTIKNVRKMVKDLNFDEAADAYYQESSKKDKDNEKLQRSFDKTIVALRVAMNRIGIVINDVEDDWITYEILMEHKRRLHDEIDLLMKQKRKRNG